MAEAKFGRLKVKLPRSRNARRAIGAALCAGGTLGFLPVLGFWMLPLGIGVLAVDSPKVRRLQRRATVGFLRWRRARQAAEADPEKKGGPE